jgi:hypothetical protein
VAAQHHGAQIAVLRQRAKGRGQFGDDAVVERIAHVGSIQPDLDHVGPE